MYRIKFLILFNLREVLNIMIKLKSFRLVNVRANNNTMLYPDVTFNLNCENTLIDAKNGGGKTLAVQMLFQTILPNSYFDENKTIKTLFLNTPPKTTMHTVASFQLNDFSEYNFLCLGFAVSKSQDISKDLNFFNYVIKGNDLSNYNLDVDTLKLKSEDNVISISELKRLLTEKNQSSDGNFKITIFENQLDEYTQFLKRFDINSQVYRFIMSINQTENFIQQYFEKHCSTQQGLLTEFIIPNTISALDEKKSALNGSSEDDISILAQSLLEKSKSLSELKNIETELEEYNKIISLIDTFLFTLKANRNDFIKYEKFLKEYSKQYSNFLFDVDSAKNNLEKISKDIIDTNNTLKSLNDKIEYLVTRKIECNIIDIQEKLSQSEEYYNKCQDDTLKLQDKLNRMLATNNVIEYKSIENRLKLIDIGSIFNKELSSYANTIYNISTMQIKKTQYEMDYVQNKISELNQNLLNCTQSIGKFNNLKSISHHNIKDWSENLNNQLIEIESLQNEISKFKKYSESLLESEELFSIVDTIKELQNTLDNLKSQQDNLISKNSVTKNTIEFLEKSVEEYSNIVEFDSNKKAKYENDVTLLKRELGVEEFEFENKYNELKSRQIDINIEISNLSDEIQNCKEEISTMKQYGLLREKSRYDALEHLQNELESACFGSEVLQSIDNIKLLERFPALAEVVLVSDKDYNAIKSGKKKFSEDILKENFVIMPYNTIRNINKLTFSEMFCLTRNVTYYKSMMDIKSKIEENNQKISSNKYHIERLHSEYDSIQNICNKIITHVSMYSFEVVQDINNGLKKNTQILKQLQSRLDENKSSLTTDTTILEECTSKILQLEDELSKAQAKKVSLERLIKLISESHKNQISITNEKKKISSYSAKINDLSLEVSSIQTKIVTFQSDFEHQKSSMNLYKSCIIEVQNYVDTNVKPIDGKDFELLIQQFKTIKNGLNVNSNDDIKSMLMNILDSIKDRDVFTTIDFDSIYNSNETLIPFDNNILDSCKLDLQKSQQLLKNQSNFIITQNNTLEIYMNQFNDRLNAEDIQYDEYRKYSNNDVENLLDGFYNEKKSVTERLNTLIKQKQTTENLYNDSNLQCELYKFFCLEKHLSLNLPCDSSKRVPFDIMNSKYSVLFNEYKSALNEVNNSIKKLSSGVDNLKISEQIKYTIKNNAIIKPSYSEILTFADRLKHLKTQAESMILNLKTTIDNIGRIDEDISEQLYRILTEILDEVSAIPKISKCKFADSYKETFKINLYTEGKGCRFSEERIKNSIKKYISELARNISNKPYNKNQIIELLSINKIIHFGIDMNRLNIQILKIDQEKPIYQNWENVIASTGQEYIMYVMFTITMIKYFNNVMGNSNKSPLFIFLDNPFASASDVQLWQPVRKFLDKNDTQILCLAHNVPSVGQILFERQIILEQSKDNEGKFVNSIRNQKNEIKENTQLSLFEHLEIL